MSTDGISVPPLQALVVDDEPLARARMKTLIADCVAPVAVCTAEAGNALEAAALIKRQHFDVALVDIHMPGTSGLDFAGSLRALAQPPAVIFITAHAEHALQAFELEAVDYLTKPVRLQRLEQALQKAQRFLQSRALAAFGVADAVVIQERGRAERVPLDAIVYFKAELKYITVRTPTRSYLWDGSLNELEDRYADRFMRVHRNALVARRAIRAVLRQDDSAEGDGWAVRLDGVQELLQVSRRQLSALKALVAE
jgi:two-component system response regulator AlgR